ncbi:MAG: hypothetical protein EOP56_10085 [Sphingobacteriales bacterium]|nr:MAG: hypothetical protein EOP56_10085 [Sphingobacteriales bacterium]
MKKSKKVVLASVLLLAIASCKDDEPQQVAQDEWTDGRDAQGKTRDTAIQQGNTVHHYRHFGGGWYLLMGGLINTGRYAPATAYDIARPGFTPQARTTPTGFRSRGFGSSARSTSAS